MTRYVAVLVAVVVALVACEDVAGHPHDDALGCRNGTTITVDECCQLPMLADQAVVDECKPNHAFKPREKGTKGEHRGPHPGACLAECIVTGMGALKNRDVDTVAFKKAIEPTLKKNPSVAKVIDAAIAACTSSMVDVGFSVTKNPDATKPPCMEAPKQFINCLYGQLFQHCPADLWTKKEGCAPLVDKIAKGCPYFALRKHHGHHKRPT